MSKSGQKKNIVHIFNDWVNAFRSRDIPKMVSLLTDDVKIYSVMFENYKGKNGASKYWQELFDAFPNIKIDIITLTSNPDIIVAEIDVSGIQKGKIGSSPGAGDKFHIRGAFVYKFSQRMKIGEIRMYYDSSILKRQLNIFRI